MAQTLFSCGDSKFVASTTEVAVLATTSQSLMEELECLPPGPVTFLSIPDATQFNSQWLEMTLAQMLAKDDVLNEAFTSRILVEATGTTPLSLGDLERCEDLGVSLRLVVATRPLKSGPYFAIGSRLHTVSRLYDDHQGAFMFGVYADESNSESFAEFPLGAIPVPSRLYFDPPSEARPLNGKRVAVKDVFHLKGTPTSVSSRDFQAFYGKADSTASMILKLMSAGGVIVGKTKTAQFASGENALDWFDYQCPFNPRGDGYLDPSGSSTGSAAGIAAYSWLDYSIGTDTLGSIVGPAAENGIFGIRPTHGISDLQGVVPVSSLLDTAGCFSRSITGLETFGNVWYGETMAQSESVPSRILYAPAEFETYSEEKQKLMNLFIQDVEHTILSSRIPFDISAAWEDSAPATASRPIQKFLKTSLAHIQLFDCYRNNLAFRKSFREKNGREPYANPMIRYKWDLGEHLSYEDYENASNERTVYRDFLRKHVFGNGTVLILPAGSSKTLYRDTYLGPPTGRENKLQGFGFLRDLYSFLGGLPQVVIPGQVLVKSPVTKGMIYEPVSISLVGPPGTDCGLIKFAHRVLQASGRAQEVKVGRMLFDINQQD